MPRPRPPHLHREVTRHGKTIWYVRLDRGPRIRIRAQFGSPDFEAEYQDAITSRFRQSARGAPAVGTLAWLVGRYRETSAWAALSTATRRQRENIFAQLLASAG